MKFMDKVKNFFTEEVEEEVKPIKKEVIQVEIPSPESDTTRVTLSSKKEEEKVEEKKSSPVYFDDKDFEDLEKKQEVHTRENYRSSYIKKEEPKKEAYNKDKNSKKAFKPSPIISPVYGVLDKNYSKEDIVSKNETKNVRYSRTSEVTIDDIRNKAYGTLEDDLDTVLFNEFKEETSSDTLIDDLNLKDDAVEIEVEKNNEDIDNFINENDNKEEYYSDDEIDSMSDDSNIVSDELESIADSDEKLESNDLFDLIDSMYEKKEDE